MYYRLLQILMYSTLEASKFLKLQCLFQESVENLNFYYKGTIYRELKPKYSCKLLKFKYIHVKKCFGHEAKIDLNEK
jgi:hypothetical protein